MLFNSINFLIFFPIVLGFYYLIPLKVRYIWLLLASYFFYMCWNAKYALLLLFSTGITYLSGVLMEYIENIQKCTSNQKLTYKKICVIGSFSLNIIVLAFFKYFDFLFVNVCRLLALFHVTVTIPEFDVLLPVGISFYTFQALSYTMDVYRREIYAEKNFFRYALFVSFFPQLVAGPIERSKNLLKQLATPQRFNFNHFREGILLMIWGYFQKVVLADRITLLVDTIYENYNTYGGFYLIAATFLFAIQIYCDFGGYSTIAMGAAKILNIDLIDNFNVPYFSQSVSEFWRRWHISLSSWFRDYLYIPLGGNRKGQFQKYLNLMIVFLISGLWHGAQWSYVFWGGLNGAYQVIGSITKPFRDKTVSVFKLNRNSFSHKALNVFTTFILIDFSWIFFRANRFIDAFQIIKSMFTVHNPWILFDGSLYKCGLNQKNFSLMIWSILLLILADFCKYRGINIRQFILKQEYWFRSLIVAGSITLILLFGIWGTGYNESGFIYFQF